MRFAFRILFLDKCSTFYDGIKHRMFNIQLCQREKKYPLITLENSNWIFTCWGSGKIFIVHRGKIVGYSQEFYLIIRKKLKTSLFQRGQRIQMIWSKIVLLNFNGKSWRISFRFCFVLFRTVWSDTFDDNVD